uniref:substrate import-associated zinc metallohydrolase lipoprotein n=1 Tax=Alistipes megaguti TaxID=2364787 RepID=UPI000EFC65B0|nr:substrate import-associated zinc metallohydrolase lipoprotein [Alistipes megaguti]
MKKLFLKSLGALLLVVAATACENDELNSQSIFDDNEQEEKSAFDLWLERHYVEPYNVNFEYRMPDRETHFNYWVAPPPLDKSIEIAKLIKFVLLDGMAELMQEQKDPLLLARTYFPRLLFLVGSYEIDGSGKVVLASAENGIQINLLGVKFFDRTKDCEQITGTMIHEFAHILDGNRAVPIEYDLITKEGYIGDQYTNAPNDYLENGFLSNYARSTPAEDIAVMVAALVGNDAQWWEETLNSIKSAEARAKIEKKRDILIAWLDDKFDIDVYRWHDIYMDRLSRVGEIDWENLDD